MLIPVYESKYKRDAKNYVNNYRVKEEVLKVLELLLSGEPLPKKYREHKLSGNYNGYLECHALPDVLLIYRRTDTHLFLYRLGSHSNLFKKS